MRLEAQHTQRVGVHSLPIGTQQGQKPLGIIQESRHHCISDLGVGVVGGGRQAKATHSKKVYNCSIEKRIVLWKLCLPSPTPPAKQQLSPYLQEAITVRLWATDIPL